MVLQSSGPISIGDIAAEFGGAAPHSLSEYYGVDSGIPTSGLISISDFYGASAGAQVDLTIGAAGTNAGYSTGDIGALDPDPFYVNGARLSFLTQSDNKGTLRLNVHLLGNRGANFFVSITTPEGTYLTSAATYLYNSGIGASTWEWVITSTPWFDIVGNTISISFVE